ncbi:hypothetical protein [Stenotrophomonas rhizophila]
MGYVHYGSIKSIAKQFDLEASLLDIWHISQLVSEERRLPYGYADLEQRGHFALRQWVFPHHLDLLLRELVLHGCRSGRPKMSLATWSGLAKILKSISQFADAMFDPDEPDAVRLMLHRIGHQQVPSFDVLSKSKVGRYLSLYRSEPLARIFESKLGINVENYFALAFAVLAGFMRAPNLNTATNFEAVGVSVEESQPFFARLVTHVDEARQRLFKAQSLTSSWEYTLNAVHSRPILNVDGSHPERVYCPIPSLLERRLFSGLFFDLVGSDGGFVNAYGAAFDCLVGRILEAGNPGCSVRKPPEYYVKKSRKDGSDWLLFDDTAHVFIECKTKRMTASGKVAASLADVRGQIQFLADAVVQNYRNIADALVGCWPFEDGGLPSYSAVVTLEDWVIFSPVASSLLNELVTDGMRRGGLPEDLLVRVPYAVMSVSDLEAAMGAINSNSVDAVFRGRLASRYSGWMFSSYLNDKYSGTRWSARVGFDKDFDRAVERVLAGADRALRKGQGK